MALAPTSRAILLGGALAGTGDILFALCFNAWRGVPPLRLLQAVASGALGRAALEGGLATAALGLALHLALSFGWAATFWLAARRVPALARHAAAAGIAFGVVVFLAMRLVVLPLSAFPFPVRWTWIGTVPDLLSHMLLFGLPIALCARQALASRARG